VLALAVHAGHEVRPEVAALLAIRDDDRLREEDPYTGRLTDIGDLGVVATRSRFEFDLNRPPERCVYREPADAWGLRVWREAPPDDLVERSRTAHGRDHAVLDALVEAALAECAEVLVLDIHSYNHRRGGPDDPGDPAAPLVDVGTRWVDMARWGAAVDAFLAALRASTFAGAPIEPELDRPFRGGYVPQRLNGTYGDRVLTLPVELRKSFMDEWTGAVEAARLDELRAAVQAAALAARTAMK
jgi:N-formylglutamate amidohydrolase